MSPLWPASSRNFGAQRAAVCVPRSARHDAGGSRAQNAWGRSGARAWLLAALACALLVPRRAHAEDARPWLLFQGQEPRSAERWRQQLARRLEPLAPAEPSARFAADAPALAPARLLALAQIEALLSSARAQTAALAED